MLIWTHPKMTLITGIVHVPRQTRHESHRYFLPVCRRGEQGGMCPVASMEGAGRLWGFAETVLDQDTSAWVFLINGLRSDEGSC